MQISGGQHLRFFQLDDVYDLYNLFSTASIILTTRCSLKRFSVDCKNNFLIFKVISLPSMSCRAIVLVNCREHYRERRERVGELLS